MPTESRPPIFVRLRRGLVGESQRVVHLVPPPDDVPDELEAYCGRTFAADTTEHLPPFSGMPCMSCIAAARRIHAPALPGDQ